MQGCSKLEVLPTNINLESLDDLDLTGCTMLRSFPEISTNLEVLDLFGTAIKEMPLTMKSWSRLEKLRMPYSQSLEEFPHAVDSITELYMTDKEIQEIPPWVKRISRLDLLVLKGCRKLMSLPQFPSTLSVIDAEDCESLERLDCSFHSPKILLNFAKCFKLNQEARDLIIQTRTSKHAVLPGGEVPAYFTHRATGGSLTIKLSERPLPTSMRFKACILPVKKGDDDNWMAKAGIHACFVKCKKSEHCLYPLLTEHLYIFEVEAEVTSSEIFFEFKLNRNDWKIGECGLVQLLEVPSC